MSSEPGPVASEHYDEDYYRQVCGGAEFFKLYGPRVLKPSLAYALKRAQISAGMTALEVGCGRGELLYQLGRMGVWAVGTDYSAAALKLAKETSKGAVARCDATRLPFRDASFDRVFLLGVMDHLRDGELEECFAELKRVLKPGGFVLATTCANTMYYKTWSYGLRRSLARLLGLKEPRPPRSDHDAVMHVNEHEPWGLARFLRRIGWGGEIEPRPNEKYHLEELYGTPLPESFPLRPAPAWKKAYQRLVFRGPWKAFLAREIFCKLRPNG